MYRGAKKLSVTVRLGTAALRATAVVVPESAWTSLAG